MTLKMTFKDLVNPVTRTALQKLGATVDMPTTVKYRIGRLIKVLNKEETHVREEWQKVEKSFKKKDVLNEAGTKVGEEYIDKGDEKLAKAKETELLDMSFDVDSKWGIDMEELDAVKLSGNELVALEPLFVERSGTGKDTNVVPLNK